MPKSKAKQNMKRGWDLFPALIHTLKIWIDSGARPDV